MCQNMGVLLTSSQFYAHDFLQALFSQIIFFNNLFYFTFTLLAPSKVTGIKQNDILTVYTCESSLHPIFTCQHNLYLAMH